MTDTEYLGTILKDQNLGNDSDEMVALREERTKVEEALLAAFGSYSPTIRYGGSIAKGTIIREAYDLDIVCYFPNDEDGAGNTLEEIFGNVQKALAEHYWVETKTSAIRLKSQDTFSDFHIDVVPGRYTDDSKSDCYLYQNGAEKCRLKTNINTHISHITEAGVTPALRLLKLWRTRRAVSMKNFVWELLCIKLLEGHEKAALPTQVEHVIRSVAEAEEAITVKDPANPEGNDLMEFLSGQWWVLRTAAQATVAQLDVGGWEAVFGPVPEAAEKTSASRLQAAAASVSTPTQPWRE